MIDVNDLQKLLESIATSEISELSLETDDYKLHIRRGPEQVLVSQGVGQGVGQGASQSAPAATPAPAQAAPQGAPAPSYSAAPVPAPSEPAPAAAPAKAANLAEVKAPIVGTFYASPTPDAPAYVKVGDRVEKGAVLCIIEAMKLMNEIEAEVTGTVAEIYVRNEEPVEYGQALFGIEPA
ncbi:MAG: acetyl-CoA carboxylase biotin carboxyl carrier protein [Trueperaceae bacterium]|nr:acetyl-CoA carboxylase biotin carboxyl carrier protein [Trueperaceae bacterium]